MFIYFTFFVVSGYFWHITDVQYDANYVATADYTQSECILLSITRLKNTRVTTLHDDAGVQSKRILRDPTSLYRGLNILFLKIK